MIFTERTITIRNESATMNTPVILYRGDKNVEVRFTIIESPFKYSNKDTINVIESTDASYAQLVIKTPNDRDPIFGDITEVGQNTITFVIGSNMIDEIEEVGAYDFQIRLFDEDQTSMVTIPEVVGGFIIKEPIAKEDTNNNITNSATVGSAVVTNDTGIPTFVGDKYNKTTWHDGDVISRQKLNKIEDGIYETHNRTNELQQQVNNNSSQIKDKVNRNEAGVITNAMLSQEVKEGMTGGSVAVVGKNSVLNENVVDGAITHNKTDFVIKGKNLFNKDNVSSKGWYIQYTNGVPVQNEYTVNLCYSDFIKVKPSSTIIVNNYLNSYCLYDAKKNFISGKAFNTTNTTIQIPSNCEYIIVNTIYDQRDTTQVEYGTVATNFEPYRLDVKYLKANTDIDEINTDIETLNADIETLDEKIVATNTRLNNLSTYKEISIDTGTATTPKDAISTFTGWGLPFKKADLKGDITYVSTYAVAYDNSTNKNLITNVPVNLELIQGSGLEANALYRPVLKVLSTSVLKESGKVEFNLFLPLDELDDVFYLAVRATTQCNLMFWNCKPNSEYTFGNYPVIYSTASSTTIESYMESNSTHYGNTDFKIGIGYAASIPNHKHKADDIEGIEGLLGASKVKLSLPDKYELVVGDTFELFYKGILLCNNPYIYNFKITCNKGACYSKRYIFTPNSSDIGIHRLEIEVYNDNEQLLDSKVVRLIVKNKPSSPSSVQNILCVGDSLSSNGAWPSEVCRRLTGTAGSPIADGLSNIKFIGTCEGTNGAKYEGYGGWTYANYNTNNIADQQYWINTTANKNNSYQKSVWKDSNNIQWVLETLEETRIKVYRNNYGTQMLPSSGTLTWVSGGDGSDNSAISYTSYIAESGNPFWDNDTNRVDFSAYATKLGVSSIDHCYVLLGWNQTYDTETTFKDGARIFINNLLASFPTCKITLSGLQVPSLDGFGTNYGCNWNYYDKLKTVFNMNKWNYELAQEFANVDFINIAGQFDSENNILTSTRPVNVRSSKTEVYGSNGVHPAYEGYMQIADAVYRNLSHKL